MILYSRRYYGTSRKFCVRLKSLRILRTPYMTVNIDITLLEMANNMSALEMPRYFFRHVVWCHIDELVQESRNSIANALELRLSCTNLSIWSINVDTELARDKGAWKRSLCNHYEPYNHYEPCNKSWYGIIENQRCLKEIITSSVVNTCLLRVLGLLKVSWGNNSNPICIYR